MARFINPFTDIGFKTIFGQEVSKELIIDFLNDLLEDEKTIRDIRFLDKEQIPDFRDERTSIYDIYCITESGEYFIVEMQNIRQVNFIDRALYYLSRIISRQGVRGNWAFNLKAVYGVFFVNFRLHDGPGKPRTDVALFDRDTNEQFSDKLRFIFIELPSFTKEKEECKTGFERWIYVLKNMETLKKIPFKDYKAVFEKLEQIASKGFMTEKERDRYEYTLDVVRDNLAVQAYIEESEARGIAKGIAKGEARGIAKGEARGEARGTLKAKIEIARNMKADGLSTHAIAEYTGLPVEEIEKLQG